MLLYANQWLLFLLVDLLEIHIWTGCFERIWSSGNADFRTDEERERSRQNRWSEEG